LTESKNNFLENPIASLVGEVIETLEYMARCGLRGCDPSDKTLGILKQWSVSSRIESENLPQIRSDLGDCRRCKLWEGRTNLVFGAGNPQARLVFVGEAPGFDEDKTGEPFVGKAGRLLTKIIGAMNMSRDEVYICNVIKCRPPGNRNPEPDEVKTCLPFLKRQLEAVRPEVICVLGSVATRALLQKEVFISRVRGKLFDYRGIKVMPTFHPSYLLRNPDKKREVWEDVQKIMALLEGGKKI
jgi:DNA polymerase